MQFHPSQLINLQNNTPCCVRLYAWVGLWLWIHLITSTVHGESIELARNGHTSFRVVLTANPTAEERTAAQWLSETLEQVTGAKFPVHDFGSHRSVASQLKKPFEIFIAYDPALQQEEWRIRATGKSLVLTGGKPRGVIYAVCEFLETHVGVARLDPFTEHVPNLPTLYIPSIDRQGKPAFESRSVFTGWPYQNGAWTEKNLVNLNRWRVWNKEQMFANPSTGDYPRSVPDGVHTLGYFLAPEEFALEHPEYFSMDAEGKRMTNSRGSKQMWFQLCVSNEDVRRITIERAKQMLEDDAVKATQESRWPAQMLVLSQNDNTANLCLCPNCKEISEREGSESGLLLDFVNHIARQLKSDFPNVTVQTEAYNFTLRPPKTIRPEPNVMIRYCDNYGASDVTRPLTDPRNATQFQLFDAWAQSSQQLGVWDYWRVFDPHPPGLFAPSSNVRAIHSDLKMFKANNVKLVTVECEDFMGGGVNADPISNDFQSFMPLRAWLGMKLMDDPSRELEPLLNTFFHGYYGAAAQPMREMLEIIEERQTQVSVNSADRRRHVWLQVMCDSTFFLNVYRCLDNAINAVHDDPASLNHVLRERIIIDSAFLWIESQVRRQADLKHGLPPRAEIQKRQRIDMIGYVTSVFDDQGQAEIAPLIEPGLQLLEKLNAEDTESFLNAIGTEETEVFLDGKLNESFWQKARPSLLLPRDPLANRDETSNYRFAWTAEALYLAIDMPVDSEVAYLEVTMIDIKRKGVQLVLHVQSDGEIASYFYAYDATGMIEVSGRKSESQRVTSKMGARETVELRIPWTDLSAHPKSHDDFLLNLSKFLKGSVRAPSHVLSPWLIGASPTYNPDYYCTLRLESLVD